MLSEKAIQIIREARYGILATSVDGQPRVRPLSWVLLDDGRLWATTYRQSGKVRELEQNAQVEVCFLAPNKLHLRVEGLLNMSGGTEKKRLLLELHPGALRHFTDEHDPKLVHLEVVPSRIRWKPMGFNEYHEETP